MDDANTNRALLPFGPDESDEDVERFRVMIEARCRHADLWPLVQGMGSQKALGDHLGVSQAICGQWVNLKSAPSLRYDSHLDAVAKLVVLTGKVFEELWPRALREAIAEGVVAERQNFEIHTSMIALAASAERRLVLPDPSEVLADEEVRGLISDEFLRGLTAAQKDVIRYRFGLNGEVPLTLAECAKKIGVTRSRVMRIERNALRKLKEAIKTSRLMQEIVA